MASPTAHSGQERTDADVAATAALTEDELAREHLYLIQHIVNEVSARFPRHVDRQELWNAGALGLVEAANRFDAATGIPFARFAAIRIRGAVLDSTRSRDWASRGVRRNARELSEADEALQRRLGRHPSTAELAEELGVDAEEVHQRRAAAETACLLHLDQQLGGEEDGGEPTTLGELVQELTAERLPEESLEQRELIGTLRAAVAHLPARLRDVLERYYYAGEYLRDIAESLEVTEARASQLRAEAIASLREFFAQQYDTSVTVDEEAPGRRRRSAYVAELASATTWRSRLAAADEPEPVTSRPA